MSSWTHEPRYQSARCLMCGCCLEVCPNFSANGTFAGIPREDYGIWYVDMMENPARYRGKVIEITAKVLKPSGFPSKMFLPGLSLIHI